MCARNRIALYGGTFDPVHIGHLEVAHRVCELFEIDKVLFVPAQIAPHKVGRPVSRSIHRHAMLVLATQGDKSLLVSTFELDKPDRSFTVDTLAHFQASFGNRADLFFIMGADSWSEISTWRDWQRLLTLANHIVVTRPGYHIAEPTELVRERVIDLRSKTDARKVETSGSTGNIFITDVVKMNVSATQIRQAASDGRFEELVKLVPKPVAEYIEKYGIYRKSNEAELFS
jgi:nicotinate-nucleotide adenylyltransferase